LNEPLWNVPEREKWFGGGYDNPGIHSICVDPGDSSHVTVAVSCGGVWVTRDGGASWACKSKGMVAEYMPPELQDAEEVQDPHRLVNCRTAPDVFYVQHHCGIYRSGDDSQTWESIVNVPPSAFGFAVTVHPDDPDTAWFVPAVNDECRIPVNGDLVVTRTRDGGKTFESLREGLPQSDAYDLIYRHGLDVDESGQRLAFGSTTGGLWLTNDQGDSWQNISLNLPPIFCVRFGWAPEVLAG
jgi:photosystem II stability/assembly factor-like uncharacterized protein